MLLQDNPANSEVSIPNSLVLIATAELKPCVLPAEALSKASTLQCD